MAFKGRFFIAVALAAFTSGCIHRIELTAEEQCAAEDMVPADVQVAGSRTANCSQPKDDSSDCRIEALKDATKPARDFNRMVPSNVGTLVVAYIAFVVPGLFLSAKFDSERNDAIRETNELRDGVLEKCAPGAEQLPAPK